MTLANDTNASVSEVEFALIPGATVVVSSTTGAVSASKGRLTFEPAFSPGARRTVTFEVDDTGHFQNWKTRKLGEIELKEAGVHTLSVVPQEKAKNAVMDIKAIRLVPTIK